MDEIKLAEIERMTKLLSLPLNSDCVYGAVRHVCRNVDHDAFCFVEGEHNSLSRNDGTNIANLVNVIPELLEEIKRLKVLEKGFYAK